MVFKPKTQVFQAIFPPWDRTHALYGRVDMCAI